MITINLQGHATNASILVKEQSATLLPVQVVDPLGRPVTPTKLQWALSSLSGETINSRTFADAVSVSSILLSYGDTNFETHGCREMILSIAAAILYEGQNLQVNVEIKIILEEMLANFPDLWVGGGQTVEEWLDTEINLDSPINIDQSLQ